MGSFGGNKSADTASKGVWRFIEMIRTKKRKRRFIDLNRFRDIGIFNKIFYLTSSVFGARFG